MMKNPCHPGEILMYSLGPEGLNITLVEAARRLGVSRVALSRVVNAKASMSTDLAMRLEYANMSTARLWLSMQTAWDIAQARTRRPPKVIALEPKQKLAA